jgi:hypothetical protein
MSLKEKLNKVFESGYFVICNVPKRVDGEWEEKIIWKQVELPGGREVKTCEWEGFTDVEECVDDCLKYINSPK